MEEDDERNMRKGQRNGEVKDWRLKGIMKERKSLWN